MEIRLTLGQIFVENRRQVKEIALASADSSQTEALADLLQNQPAMPTYNVYSNREQLCTWECGQHGALQYVRASLLFCLRQFHLTISPRTEENF